MKADTRRELYFRRQVETERTHRESLRRELARSQRLTPVGLRDLMGQYPPLRRLLQILADAAELQDPMSGRSIDGTSPVVAVKGGGSRDEGAGTRSDRMRVRRWIRRLDGITRSFEQELGGQEFDDLPEPVVCHRKVCAGRGKHQPWDATHCRWCGRSFDED